MLRGQVINAREFTVREALFVRINTTNCRDDDGRFGVMFVRMKSNKL